MTPHGMSSTYLYKCVIKLPWEPEFRASLDSLV